MRAHFASLVLWLLWLLLLPSLLCADIVLERTSGSTAVAGTQVTVLSFRATPLHSFRLTLENTGGSNALTDVKVLAGPTAAEADVDIDTSPSISNTLAAGAKSDFVVTSNVYGWIKLVCTAHAVNTTTVVGYVVGN